MKLITCICFLHSSMTRLVSFVIILTASFNGWLKATVAATWNTMFTFSINIILSSKGRTKSGRLTSPSKECSLLKIEPCFSLINSKTWKRKKILETVLYSVLNSANFLTSEFFLFIALIYLIYYINEWIYSMNFISNHAFLFFYFFYLVFIFLWCTSYLNLSFISRYSPSILI